MAHIIISILLLICTFNEITETKYISTNESYWRARTELQDAEEKMHLGYKLELTSKEKLVNSKLMEAKHAELKHGLETPVDFLPSMNFLKAKSGIEQSKVFEIIKKIPKGAVLHSHDTAMVSTEFLYNLTYTNDLFICITKNTKEIRFKFATEKPKKTEECDEWNLLSELRQNKTIVDELNANIKSSFTLLVNDPDVVYFDVNEVWKKFVSIFLTLDGFLNYRPVLEDYLYQVFKEFENDKILHLEFRGTLPQTYELNGTVYNEVELVGIYQSVVKRFQSEYPHFSVKFIYAPNRKVDQTTFDQYIEIVKNLHGNYSDFLAGFDLVGQEDLGVAAVEFADKLLKLKEEINIDFYFHAGETNWKGMTDENLFESVLLDSKRIGHGYAITKHPKLMEIVRDKGIAIEISPISNQVLNLVKDLRNHPAAELFSTDFPVVISNDDPSLWGAIGLSYDFYEAFMAFTSYNDDIRVLKQLGYNSILFSSMNVAEKSRALVLFENQWDSFINEMIMET
ncbi:adenosine deaminase 2-like [Chrysoperla carnea]|uniref:adenosine deaminase 2-like n=1 Tax=Chrysoperla carnea TaxID=189513 RepID=UPI001D06FFDD|nr:adenosine deaminase 2-like [Chrysoperla carnea]